MKIIILDMNQIKYRIFICLHIKNIKVLYIHIFIMKFETENTLKLEDLLNILNSIYTVEIVNMKTYEFKKFGLLRIKN